MTEINKKGQKQEKRNKKKETLKKFEKKALFLHPPTLHLKTSINKMGG